MKTKYKIVKSLFVAGLVGLFALRAHAINYLLINGLNGTNYQYVVVNGTTNQVGVFAPLTTNVFNLATGIGTQTNPTNWPSGGDSMNGYPGTLYGPNRIVTIAANCSFNGPSNNTGVIPIVFAGYTGTIWVTNAYIFPYTASTPVATNIDTFGYQAIALQEIRNTNTSSSITNLQLELSEKPGF